MDTPVRNFTKNLLKKKNLQIFWRNNKTIRIRRAKTDQ